jgi:hypothetical protein
MACSDGSDDRLQMWRRTVGRKRRVIISLSRRQQPGRPEGSPNLSAHTFSIFSEKAEFPQVSLSISLPWLGLLAAAPPAVASATLADRSCFAHRSSEQERHG